MDPFVVVQYQSNKQRTKTVDGGGQNPKWEKEKFEFKIEKLTDKITFRCFDEDSIVDDSLGELSVAIKLIAKEGITSQEWIKLKFKDKASCELLIETKFQASEKK